MRHETWMERDERKPPSPLDLALAEIGRKRKKLSDDYWRDMAQLDAEERKLLGLR